MCCCVVKCKNIFTKVLKDTHRKWIRHRDVRVYTVVDVGVNMVPPPPPRTTLLFTIEYCPPHCRKLLKSPKIANVIILGWGGGGGGGLYSLANTVPSQK